MNPKDIDAPHFPKDNEKELANAEFSSADRDGKIRTATRKIELFAQALEAGLTDATPELIDKAVDDLGKLYESLVHTFPWAVIQKGPASNPHNLPPLIRDQRDDEQATKE
ncbi:MAG: hypothetical protein WAZ50_03050 [Minisyncoccia bacterium]